MDHLPTPKDASLDGLGKVPYVCEKPYDGGPFITFPQRLGKPQAMLTALASSDYTSYWQYERVHPTPVDELEDFLQTWLFFGLGHEILGTCFNPKLFITTGGTRDRIKRRISRLSPFILTSSRESPSKKTISTVALPKLVDSWILDSKQSFTPVKYEHIAQCLHLAFKVLFGTRQADTRVNPLILLSIASVAELLSIASNAAFQPVKVQTPHAWASAIDKSFWREAMLHSGYCPSQTKSLLTASSSIQTLNFMSLLSQKGAREQHEECRNNQCLANQVDLQSYETKHVEDSCSCDEILVDGMTIHRILLDGHIPVVSIKGDKLSDIYLDLETNINGREYVALSHVWADGLGNKRANGLPRCQLLRLGKVISAIPPRSTPRDREVTLNSNRPLLWCDTLCCPRRPVAARKLALAGFDRVYREASQVLVLDSSIEQFQSRPLQPEDAWARVLTSNWMRRLWTLQEGALIADDKQLWFQFSDGPYNFPVHWKDTTTILSSRPCWHNLVGEILAQRQLLRGFSLHDADFAGRDLLTVEGAIQHRAVSYRPDEALLIGSLLGLDKAKILDGPDDTRMHRLWTMMPTVPRGIGKNIVFRGGSRLQEAGYRWAPSTLLGGQDVEVPQTDSVADRNQGKPGMHGLYVQLPGTCIRLSQRHQYALSLSWHNSDCALAGDQFNVRGPDQLWYRLGLNRDKMALSTGSLLQALTGRNRLYILSTDFDQKNFESEPQPSDERLLVSLDDEIAGTRFVRSLQHVDMRRYPNSYNTVFEAAFQCAQQLAGNETGEYFLTIAFKQDKQSKERLNVEERLKGDFDTYIAQVERKTLDMVKTMISGSIMDKGYSKEQIFRIIATSFFLGHYAEVGPESSETQEWCVD